jgi:hypothetical protein
VLIPSAAPRADLQPTPLPCPWSPISLRNAGRTPLVEPAARRVVFGVAKWPSPKRAEGLNAIYGCSCHPRCTWCFGFSGSVRPISDPQRGTGLSRDSEQSELEAGLRQTSFDQCMQGEQTDRETMIKEWSTFSADDRRHCVAEATMGGSSSYTDLLTCLEMARDVRQLHSQARSSSQANSSSAPAQQVAPAPVGHRQPTGQ